MRTFIAIEIDDTLRNRLAAIRDELQLQDPVMRWVKPDRMHLTLRFLGEIDPSLVTPVTKAIQNASQGVKPFELKFKGLGFFPNAGKPRVFWVGIRDQDKTLELLVRSLELELMKIGFEREKRPFRPHLTLARIKGKITGGIHIGDEAQSEYGQQSVSSIKLFKSDLRPQGPIYTLLSEVDLK